MDPDVITTKCGSWYNCLITDHAIPGLQFVRFFNPVKEGVTVEAVTGGVRVQFVDAAKPFAKAGLQKSDVILAVDGKAVDSVEAFRKQLRGGFASAEGFTLQLRRDGKTQDLWVDSPW